MSKEPVATARGNVSAMFYIEIRWWTKMQAGVYMAVILKLTHLLHHAGAAELFPFAEGKSKAGVLGSVSQSSGDSYF